MTRQKTVRREVRSEDPSLSPEANRLLTGELREAVGSDHVEVPEDALERSRDRHADGSGFMGALARNRVLLLVSLLVLLTVGAIIALITGSWWALLVAAGVHALGTLVTAASAIQITTDVEHVDPTTAARLEAEGVGDPDRLLSDLVEDYAGADHARGTTEVVSTGHNENAADPLAEPAKATVEQRTAITPSARASSPSGSGSVIGWMPVTIVAGLVVLSLAFAIAEGGAMWAVPAILWACAAGWLALVLRVDGRAEERAAREGRPLTDGGPRRAPGDGATAVHRRVAPFVAVVVVGVVGFCALVAAYLTST